MKKPYTKFDISDNIGYTDIIGKKFILVDDNVTTGRSFIGLKNFIEENGGQVVDYYAPTKGTDWSEKLIASDETWKKILDLNEEFVSKGKPSIYEFAEMSKLKREISQKGLTEREAEEFYRRYKMVGGDDQKRNYE